MGRYNGIRRSFLITYLITLKQLTKENSEWNIKTHLWFTIPCKIRLMYKRMQYLLCDFFFHGQNKGIWEAEVEIGSGTYDYFT